MSYGLGQVFALETCPPQGWGNSSNAWEKEILLQGILMENRGNPIFLQFQAEKCFVRLANMCYGIGQVFALETCPPQSWSNSSNAWGKEILLQVILMENFFLPLIVKKIGFSLFSIKKPFNNIPFSQT